MNLQATTATPLTYFQSLVAVDQNFPLLEAAAAIAQDEEPGLDVQEVLATCDALLVRLKRRLKPDAEPLQKLTVLNQFFYNELGFGCNANNFYAPENSYLNEVFRTRRGIPISIAVIWLELAQALDLQADGVSFPGHFLVKVTLPEGLVVMDPLTGDSLGLDRLTERLAPYRQGFEVAEDGEESDTPLGLYLQPAMPRDILTRMLRNLKEIFSSQSDWQRLKCVLDRLIVLNPDAIDERRDRGLALLSLGLNAEARDDLQAYVSQATDAKDLDFIRLQLASIET
ncbi:MAG: transglutaminase [Betaproteobacteria bacterium]|jgi:regulator of sirC expression with transglutaminase-like and TPR domain|nr:transglutaminase [Betaproteobacteria bacterium]NDB44473.1 transglutaminase [Betaproteobacteria bacterium]NDD01427.1 transglutaminase [Betaproteobacteria bacterium]NDE23530.1 transglutaminase [Betaproteobacteria bacterium]NDF77970.1 transglutaminase [Betaproteobacteria bacterium]